MTESSILRFLLLALVFSTCLGMMIPRNHLSRARREADKKYVGRIVTCVRNKLGTAENKESKCVVREMLRVFAVKERVKCKNCDQFFYCTANFNARRECGDGSHVTSASEAVSQCQDKAREDVDESLTVAAGFGRNNGNCGQEYLCSSGCKFASSNETCTLSCR